ncbi:MAG: hypothetical protein ACR2RF_05875, partial [Geminicoccaceae bacterium]
MSFGTEDRNVISLLLAGVAAAALWIPGTVLAEEKALDSEEIKSLLSGATIKGIHYGVETRQYFSESGLTLWIKEGDDKPSEARYKIEADQYCSSWTGLWNEEEWGLPIRLLPTPTICGVGPFSGVELVEGWRGGPARDSEQRA